MWESILADTVGKNIFCCIIYIKRYRKSNRHPKDTAFLPMRDTYQVTDIEDFQ